MHRVSIHVGSVLPDLGGDKKLLTPCTLNPSHDPLWCAISSQMILSV